MISNTNFKIMSVIILCIILPIFLWISHVVIFTPHIPNIMKKTAITFNKSNLYGKLQTGDLLFFSGTHILERGIRYLQNGPYSHVCLVVNNDRGLPYILELDNHPKKELIGVHLIPLLEKMVLTKGKRNNNNKFYVEWHASFLSERPTFSAVKSWMEKFRNYDRDLAFFSWLSSDIPSLLKYIRKNDSIFCSELIVKFLTDNGYVSPMHHSAWYSPEHLRHMDGLIRKNDVYWINRGLISF